MGSVIFRPCWWKQGAVYVVVGWDLLFWLAAAKGTYALLLTPSPSMIVSCFVVAGVLVTLVIAVLLLWFLLEDYVLQQRATNKMRPSGK